MNRIAILLAVTVVVCRSAAGLAQETDGSAQPPVAEAAAAPPPAAPPSAEESLEALLSEETIAVGETGSFGYRLTSYGVTPYVHAYTTAEWFAQQGAVNTFDLHYFNVFVGADILGKIVPEIQLEYEHGGSEFGIRFAQVDFKVHSLLTVRVGSFLVPVGVFNEYLYPEFITKTADRPFALREIVPASWQEIGVQLRGKYDFGAGRNVSYAAFVVNGLQQADDPTTPDEIEDGGGIRNMRGNFVEKNDGDKAFGGRLGIEPLDGARVGASFYQGAYTADGKQRLTIYDVDAGVTWRDLSVRAEFTAASQETALSGTLKKQGFYVLAAYRFLAFEPVLQYDAVRLGGKPAKDRTRVTAGVNWYPYPSELPSVVVKANYQKITDGGPQDAEDDKFIVQMSMGF